MPSDNSIQESVYFILSSSYTLPVLIFSDTDSGIFELLPRQPEGYIFHFHCTSRTLQSKDVSEYVQFWIGIRPFVCSSTVGGIS